MTNASLLRAYDAQLRAEGEVVGADSVDRLGPLLLALFGGRRGFVTYPSLTGFDTPDRGPAVDALIASTIAHFEAMPTITSVEWKTRGHDAPGDLPGRLAAAGFAPDEQESVMVGEASGLAVDVALPDGYLLRRADSEVDVRAASTTASEVFGDSPDDTARHTDHALARFRDPDSDAELWLVEHDGRVVCSGRLEPVQGSEFAGLWGGSCLAEHRGLGLYRALTAARARAALALGKRYLHSDSTEFSRPILERSGLIKVTTTTPYVWCRP